MDAVADYHSLIDAILAATGMSDKTAHVHAGLAIFLLAQVVLRTRRGSIDALLAVVLAEALNETMDRLFFGSWRWSDTLGDIVSTLAWPTLLVVASRYRRARWQAGRRVARQGADLLRTVARPAGAAARRVPRA